MIILKSEPPYCTFTPGENWGGGGRGGGVRDQSRLDGRNEENPRGQGTKANGQRGWGKD
jgi:hypothetical protein